MQDDFDNGMEMPDDELAGEPAASDLGDELVSGADGGRTPAAAGAPGVGRLAARARNRPARASRAARASREESGGQEGRAQESREEGVEEEGGQEGQEGQEIEEARQAQGRLEEVDRSGQRVADPATR